MRPIVFGEFRLDLEAGRLWRGDTDISLRAKSFAVLRHLALNRGRLVSREELHRVCWLGTSVSDSVLRVSMGEIRAALGETAHRPIFVTTVGRRGYRFEPGSDADSVGEGLVGRDPDLARLHEHLAVASAGRRRLVFVTGEPGIGKTAVLDQFRETVRADGRLRVGLGQCVELAGAREAYLPVLDLLGRLCSEADGHEVIGALERWAPSWLLQMPGVIDAARSEALTRRVPSPNRERMLRELAEALEALARDRALVLILEDLHWSDASTVDALAYLAQRTTSARLLVVGSYRPVDLVLGDHPLRALKQSLQARGRCVELPLELLTRADVGVYLARRLAGRAIDPALAGLLHRKTDGNPLFMTTVVDYLVEQRLLAPDPDTWRVAGSLDGVLPESLRQLVERQLDALGRVERRVLDAASIVGVDFAAAPVAAATSLRPDAVEDICSRLAASGRLVCTSGVSVWPDGTASGSFTFRHAVYREVIEQLLAPARRRRLHRAVGERIERGYPGRTREVAALLASHFAQAGDDARALAYHGEAASAARARFADREVILHLQAALEHLPRLADTPERAQTELAHLLELGAASLAVQGYASADAVTAYARARGLAARLELPQAEMLANGGLYTYHVMRGELRLGRRIAEELLATASRMAVPLFAVIGHTTLGCAVFNLGEFHDARVHLEQAHAAWTPDFPRLAIDPAVLHRSMLGFTLLHQGQPSAAAAWIRRSLEHAAALDDPFNHSYALELAAQYHATAGDREGARLHADRSLVLAREHGFPMHQAVAATMLGWVQGDVAAIEEGIATYERLGQRVATSFFRALLVETQIARGQLDAALAVLGTALAFADESGEHRHLAELHRLRGECSRRRGDEALAEADFRRAIEIARTQGARLWELRAALGLGELWRDRGRLADARQMFAEACEGAEEGDANPDALRARVLRGTV